MAHVTPECVIPIVRSTVDRSAATVLGYAFNHDREEIEMDSPREQSRCQYPLILHQRHKFSLVDPLFMHLDAMHPGF